MDKKIVVIDGIARSGTTLLSSMIHSQHDSACYRGILHEFLACDIGCWKKDYALFRYLGSKDNVIFKKRKTVFYKYLMKLNRNLYLQYDRLVDNTMNTLHKKQSVELCIQTWEDIFRNSNVTSMNDLDKLYQNIATSCKVNLLGMRWNQGLPYISKFLRNTNHYWLSVIRNPMDRAISDYKTFNEGYNDSLMYTDNYGKILDKTKELENHMFVYFEDIINNPSKELKRIYDFFGLPLDTINLNLKNQSGDDYVVETSNLTDKNMKHTHGEKFMGFDESKINKWKHTLNQNIISEFFKIMNKYDVYKRYTCMQKD